MRLKLSTSDPALGILDLEVLNPKALEGRMRDTAALQREMRWTMDDITAMCELEMPSVAMAVFFTLRSAGRLISYARAEALLDEIEFIPEPGDVPDEDEQEAAEDPTSAPTGIGRGGDVDQVEPSLP